MKQRLLDCANIVLVLCSLWWVPEGWTQLRSEEIGMVTGSVTGTYFQFGRDIAEVARQSGLQIVVKESQGSIENIRRLVSKENVAFSIVQSDLMSFLKRSNDPTMIHIASQLRLIAPFYNEEVHLVGTKEIKSIEDLRGKRVVVGQRGSGTWLTATNLLNMSNIIPAERLELPPPEAVQAVLTGKADAMFYVAGAPTPLFRHLTRVGNDPRFGELVQKVHFVPLQNPQTLREYLPSRLDPQDYAWLEKAVDTVAVKAMLISFDFSSSQTHYSQHRCTQLALLGKVLREQLAQLQSSAHHPKWKEVRLDQQEAGIWKWDTCSQSRPIRPPFEGAILDCLKGKCGT